MSMLRVDNFGNALQAAAYRGRKEKFTLLLEHGAVTTHDGTFDSLWDTARYGAERSADAREKDEEEERRSERS